MKLILAKIIYYAGIVGFIGITIGMFAALAWFIITTIPFFLAILAGFAVLVGFGLLFGWAENIINNTRNVSSADR